MGRVSVVEIIFTAIGLAMDCFAVALSAGAAVKKIKAGNVMKIALLFGGFQAGMSFLGWSLGGFFVSYIEEYAHWTAFIILAVLGAKMIKEGFENKKEEQKDYFENKIMFFLAIATSIDALAAGVGFSVLKIPVFIPVSAIGIASFVFTIAGVVLGKKAGDMLGKRAEILGGIILIGIGVRLIL